MRFRYSRGFYEFARGSGFLVLLALWRMRSSGEENVPAEGPVILACNHVSYLDPVVLGIPVTRPLTYLAKKELFALPILGPIVTMLGAYPLDRQSGGVAAVRAALRVLSDGRCVGIFPEGRRNRSGDAPEKGGAALLASLSGAPVVPCAIAGTRYAGRFDQIRVTYGEPLTIPRNRKAQDGDLEKWTTEIMRQIRALEESIGDH